MAVTLVQICDGIESTLGAATGMTSATSYDELTEGIVSLECPRIEVYPDSGLCDPGGGTDRTAFNAGVQQVVITIFADLYARQRSNLGEDMSAYVTLVDAVIDVLQAEEKPPFFGVTGIKALSWSWKRAVFRRASVYFAGARFTILCRIF